MILRFMPPNPPESPALHDRALQDLSFIRRTMEGAASFTDVPGWGLVGVGSTAVIAAPLAAQQPSATRWILVWLATAIVAVSIGTAAMWQKMRRRVTAGEALQLNTPTRKFLFGFWPAILVGAVLTGALTDPFTPGIEAHLTARLLPGLWLLLYGLGVLTAGAYSIRAVPLMGMVFMALGAITLLVPFAIGDVMMGLGFGLLQLAFGIHIARRHGG